LHLFDLTARAGLFVGIPRALLGSMLA